MALGPSGRHLGSSLAVHQGPHYHAIHIKKIRAGTTTKDHKQSHDQSYRFRSFAISIYMVLEHVKQWLLIWRSISIHLRRINNRFTSWSAVCCPLFVFEVRKEFPSEQLGFCTVAHLLLLQILFLPLDLQIKVILNGRFQGEAGPPQVDVSRH